MRSAMTDLQLLGKRERLRDELAAARAVTPSTQASSGRIARLGLELAEVEQALEPTSPRPERQRDRASG